MTDPAFIAAELQAINGALALANGALKRVQTQCPPGPPSEPTQVKLLNQIVTNAQSVQQIANAILKNGGSGQ